MRWPRPSRTWTSAARSPSATCSPTSTPPPARRQGQPAVAAARRRRGAVGAPARRRRRLGRQRPRLLQGRAEVRRPPRRCLRRQVRLRRRGVPAARHGQRGPRRGLSYERIAHSTSWNPARGTACGARAHRRRLRRGLLPGRPGSLVDRPRGGLVVHAGVHPVRGLRADRGSPTRSSAATTSSTRARSWAVRWASTSPDRWAGTPLADQQGRTHTYGEGPEPGLVSRATRPDTAARTAEGVAVLGQCRLQGRPGLRRAGTVDAPARPCARPDHSQSHTLPGLDDHLEHHVRADAPRPARPARAARSVPRAVLSRCGGRGRCPRAVAYRAPAPAPPARAARSRPGSPEPAGWPASRPPGREQAGHRTYGGQRVGQEVQHHPGQHDVEPLSGQELLGPFRVTLQDGACVRPSSLDLGRWCAAHHARREVQARPRRPSARPPAAAGTSEAPVPHPASSTRSPGSGAACAYQLGGRPAPENGTPTCSCVPDARSRHTGHVLLGIHLSASSPSAGKRLRATPPPGRDPHDCPSAGTDRQCRSRTCRGGTGRAAPAGSSEYRTGQRVLHQRGTTRPSPTPSTQCACSRIDRGVRRRADSASRPRRRRW